MATPVYFGNARQSRLRADETLPAKLDIIIEKLNLRERVKDKSVAIKMHLGGHIGYSTIHPVFVRKLVQAVKDGGGRPFVTDTAWACSSAHERGYAHDTIGCLVLPCAGPDERYYRVFPADYKGITEFKIGGTLLDADFLIDFAHVKGHPSCGMGGVFKNLALGAMIGETRGKIHDTVHFDQYWFTDKCPDEDARKNILAACEMEAIVLDRDDPTKLHRHSEPCNQCGSCVEAAPEGSLTLDPVNFFSFQEACAIGVSKVLSQFEPENQVYINIATDMTPVCDCFGFTGCSILPDVGMFAGNNICAVEQAMLDEVGKYKVIEENVPLSMKLQHGEGFHPFQVVHGEYKDPYKVIEYAAALGVGSRDYEMIDVMPLEDPRASKSADMVVSASDL